MKIMLTELTLGAWRKEHTQSVVQGMRSETGVRTDPVHLLPQTGARPSVGLAGPSNRALNGVPPGV